MIGSAISNAKETQLEITVTKADGTVVKYGVVSYWHKNTLKRLLWRIKKWLHY